MSTDRSTPAPGTPDDDFLARLRRSADAAVPPSTLDLDVSLRAVRRTTRVRRVAATSVGALAVAAVGSTAALAGPAILDRAEGVLAADVPYEILAPDVTTVEVAPGIVAVSEPATYVRDDGTYVLDLGLGTWNDGERFFAELDADGPDGRSMADLRIIVGDDDVLSDLRRGADAGTVLIDGFTNGALVVGDGTGQSVYVGLDGLSSGSATADDRSTWLLLAGETDGTPGTAVTSVEVPESSVGGFALVAALLGADGVPVPDVRGVYSRDASTSSLNGCGDAVAAPDGESWTKGCRVEYDPTARTVTEGSTPPGILDNAVVRGLRELLPEKPDRSPYDPALLVECLALRGYDVPAGDDAVYWTMPSGAQGDAWRQCQLDVVLVSQEWYTAHADEIQGKELPTGWD